MQRWCLLTPFFCLFSLFCFRSLRRTGTGRAETLPRLAPLPTATTRKTLTDDPAHWNRTTATEKIDVGKDRKNDITLPTWLQLSFFCLFVWFGYFKCLLFFLTYCSALVIILFVWLAECTDGRVKKGVCCVHASVVLLLRVVGFVFHYFWHVTEFVVGVGTGTGGTALLLFLAHYIIIIINIIAVLLLVLQLFSF